MKTLNFVYEVPGSGGTYPQSPPGQLIAEAAVVLPKGSHDGGSCGGGISEGGTDTSLANRYDPLLVVGLTIIFKKTSGLLLGTPFIVM